ncbi:MAG: chorismate synthase [Dehalococcoidia bacterium]|nr:MAG: chorismate synthase [Dehalococcoidia bacterium]
MLRFLTAGESHGKGLIMVIEGMPAGLQLSEDDIAGDLRRRQGGYGRGRRQKIEQDRAEIMSGVRHGLTLGSPISLLILNRDWVNWTEAMSVNPIEGDVDKVTRLRPGHADLAGAMKYDFDDVRNVLERASARETAARVAVGAVCKRFLESFGMAFHSHTVRIGPVEADVPDEIGWTAVEESPVRCADAAGSSRMVAAIDDARNAGDTLGGIVEGRATNVPIGLGSHVHWDRKIDGLLAQALMSIHSVKGVEIGGGFASATRTGSQVHDVILPREQWTGRPWARATNSAGGTEGGITDGQDVVVRVALKPIATLPRSLPSADLHTGEEIAAHYERSDVCVVPAAGVIVEAMCAIVLATAALDKFGGDSMSETLRNWRAFEATAVPRDLREG